MGTEVTQLAFTDCEKSFNFESEHNVSCENELHPMVTINLMEGRSKPIQKENLWEPP
jgi:hypothetical protein